MLPLSLFENNSMKALSSANIYLKREYMKRKILLIALVVVAIGLFTSVKKSEKESVPVKTEVGLIEGGSLLSGTIIPPIVILPPPPPPVRG